MKNLEKQVWEKLKEVPDPELDVSVVDLGLIYKVGIDKQTVEVTMTLTTMGCPLFSVFEEMIRAKVLELPEIQEVKINLVFEPVWGMEKMSEAAKVKLGIV